MVPTPRADTTPDGLTKHVTGRPLTTPNFGIPNAAERGAAYEALRRGYSLVAVRELS